MIDDAAERLALGMVDAERKRRRKVQGAEVLEIDGLVLAFSNLPDPALNSIVVSREPNDPHAALDDAKAAFVERAQPLGIDVQLGRHARLDAAIRTCDLRLIIERPGMVTSLAALPPVPIPDGIRVARVLDEVGAEAIAQIGVDAFDDDQEVGRAFYGVSSFGVDGMATFVAWDGDDPVGMASGYLHEGAVGVMGVGVVERARRRGIGAAVTAAAATAFDGADIAWLHPSDMARPMYEHLGFREVSRWEVWVEPWGEPPGVHLP